MTTNDDLKVWSDGVNPETVAVHELYGAVVWILTSLQLIEDEDLPPTSEDLLRHKSQLIEAIEPFLEMLRHNSEDTAHLGPFTCVRACIHCGVLVSGGPTACLACTTRLDKESMDDADLVAEVKAKCREIEDARNGKGSRPEIELHWELYDLVKDLYK